MGNAKNSRRTTMTAVWIIIAAFVLYTIIANTAMIASSGSFIVDAQNTKNYGADYILVLGAKIEGDTPGPTLKNRLDSAVDLYKQGIAPRLLLTGDGGARRQDEVSVMQRYVLDAGVSAEDIVLDREGFDTYDSIYRAKEVFGVRRVVIVTQAYHLYRAIYIARTLGLETKGVAARPEQAGQVFRDIREVAARCKDFVTSFIKPQSSSAPNALGQE